jgi:hypothetical protein
MSFKPLDTDRSNNVSPIVQYEESPMRRTIVMLKRQEVGQLLGGFEDKLILVIDPAYESDHRRDLSGTRSRDSEARIVHAARQSKTNLVSLVHLYRRSIPIQGIERHVLQFLTERPCVRELSRMQRRRFRSQYATRENKTHIGYMVATLENNENVRASVDHYM